MKREWGQTNVEGAPAVRVALLGALAGGIAMLGACSSPTPAFDLTAPRPALRSGGIAGQLVIVEPAALQPLENESIIAKGPGTSVSVIGGGQWSDRLPRLIQARLIQTFENASKIKAVGRPGDGTAAQYQLTTEIRAFNFEAGGTVVAELSAKLIAIQSGQAVRARIFTSRLPVGSANAAEVAQTLDKALSAVLVEIVRWTATGR